MTITCGIYGFNITQKMEFNGLKIIPRTNNVQEARTWARDMKTYHLTATLEASEISEEFLFNLEAVLSFIEHLDVLITPPINLDIQRAQLTKTIIAHKRNSGGGATIGEDALFPNSRIEFIKKTIDLLENVDFCTDTQFKSLFFKKVTTFRQVNPYIEVSYFLLYSGLESFARAVTADKDNKNSSETICKLLNNYGFNLSIEKPDNLARAVSTYTHLRNALFHNSELSKVINLNGKNTELKLIDFFYNIEQLVTLTIMKAVNFDDNHINWDSWIDRQPFK
jgi:hypothetical protein